MRSRRASFCVAAAGSMVSIAASISIAITIGWRALSGASSVRTSAVATPSGTAIRSAMSEETRVPNMNGRAPYLSATGSHCELHRKPVPKLAMDCFEPT